jgi:hypothetical protein
MASNVTSCFDSVTNGTNTSLQQWTSCRQDVLQDKASGVHIALLSAVTLAILALNIPVIVAILTKRSLRKQPYMLHLLSLSITDALVGIGLLPTAIVYTVGDGGITYDQCSSMHVVYLVSSAASTLHLLVICIERCWAVRRKTAVSHHGGNSILHTCVVYGLTWMGAVVISAPYVIWRREHDIDKCTLESVFEDNLPFALQYFSTYYIIATVSLLISYLWLSWYILYRRSQTVAIMTNLLLAEQLRDAHVRVNPTRSCPLPSTTSLMITGERPELRGHIDNRHEASRYMTSTLTPTLEDCTSITGQQHPSTSRTSTSTRHKGGHRAKHLTSRTIRRGRSLTRNIGAKSSKRAVSRSRKIGHDVNVSNSTSRIIMLEEACTRRSMDKNEYSNTTNPETTNSTGTSCPGPRRNMDTMPAGTATVEREHNIVRRARSCNQPSTSSRSHAHSEVLANNRTHRKALLTIGLVVVCYCMCMVPQTIVVFSMQGWDPSSVISRSTRHLVVYLATLNSAVNPVIYAFGIKKLRACFVDWIRQFALFRRR